jgi:hypothetical protein
LRGKKSSNFGSVNENESANYCIYRKNLFFMNGGANAIRCYIRGDSFDPCGRDADPVADRGDAAII